MGVKIGGTAVHLSAHRNYLAEKRRWAMREQGPTAGQRKWIQHTGENRLRWEQGLLAQVTEGRSAHGTDARGITDLVVEAPQSSL